MRKWTPLWVLLLVAGCPQQACPSPPGGRCDPRNANCPAGYVCALGAERCTRTCEQTTDCWLKVETGCRGTELPGMTLPDGGITQEQNEDGFCPESKLLECLGGYCQLARCADGGCDYDVYGPSEYKGNRDQGPEQ